uniref:Uncharacterized protein n=1 Tax=Rhizophora mucronata TaxID=61149 RepID=A0A2P2MAM8_RHIMU
MLPLFNPFEAVTDFFFTNAPRLLLSFVWACLSS